MCALRRTVSVPSVLSPRKVSGDAPPAPATVSGVTRRRFKSAAAAASGPRPADVHCRSRDASPGVSHLWVTPGPCTFARGEEGGFLAVLGRALSAVERCAVTYDFRSCMPDPDFTRGLAEFYQEHLELWAGRVKSAALLIQDNVLEAAARGPVATFLRACPCPPGCPFVLCHSAGMVEEFFEASLGIGKATPYSGAMFLSVVDVLEDPRERPSFWPPRHKARSCLASLAPSPSLAEARAGAQMFHVLPNGDTRVIQSPPQDVVVRADSGRVLLGRGALGEDVKLLAPAPEEATGEHATLAALAFACPRDELKQIVGAHFHVGELAVDAETESLVRVPGRTYPDERDTERLCALCGEGLMLLLSQAFGALVPGPRRRMPAAGRAA